MKVYLTVEPDGEFKAVNFSEGLRVKDICVNLPNKTCNVVAAKVNNRFVDLNYSLSEGDKVELLDMRTQAANLVYIDSLSLIYVKAVYDILGDVTVEIMNSLNQGLYTRIQRQEGVTESEIEKIEHRMKEIVEADLPFHHQEVDVETAVRYLREDKREDRIKLIESSPNIEKVSFYELDGYRDFFYGSMVPSTGYIKLFELKKYGDGILLRFPLSNDPEIMPEYVDQDKLFAAFKEQSEWDSLLGISYVADLNEKIASGEAMKLIQLSEALHEKKIAEIADKINMKGSRIVLIAGPSSSGKTTFAKRLSIQLMVNGLNPMYLGTDDYFVEREKTPLDADGEPDYEGLGALDIDLFNRNMNDLLAGKEVDLPTFDFITGHKVFGKRITTIAENQIIVIEGIHALNEELTKFIPGKEKFKIYISPLTQLNIDIHNRIPTTDERMLRRLVRDYQFRGYSAKSTLKNWPKVRAGEDKNIFPYSCAADVLFNSYHIYEISILRKLAEPMLREVSPEDKEYAEAQRILRFLQFFRTIEDDTPIVNNSILREFIGGSIFIG
jgi:uridine kinase